MKIKHVGKLEVDGNRVYKTYSQTVAGSAWKKIGVDILLLRKAGYSDIKLKVNVNHPNLEDIKWLVEVLRPLYPGVTVEKTE